MEKFDNSLIDKKISTIAVSKNVYAIFHVPNRLLDNELLTLTVQNDPTFIKKLPEDLRSPEICLIAYKADPKTMGEDLKEYIPDRIKKERNIYKFCVELEFASKCTFPIDEIHRYYGGEEFNIPGTKGMVKFTPEKGLHKVEPPGITSKQRTAPRHKL